MRFQVKLDDNAIMPTKAHTVDAGFDIYARNGGIVPKHGSLCFNTGVHINIPKGFVGFLKSKSGLNVNAGITSEGVIDSGYTGAIVVKLYNNSGIDYYVARGEKISQIVFLPIPNVTLKQVDSFKITTERGDKGFGSSGR